MMTLFQDVNTKQQQSRDIDSVGRARVCEAFSMFDAQFRYDLDPLLFTSLAVGAGSVSHIADSSAARLSTGGTVNGDGVVFQTKQYHCHQTGKSQVVLFSASVGEPIANVRRRIGLFDEDNGFFFEQDGAGPKMVRRSSVSGSPVDDPAPQSEWNLDRLDGLGPSKLILEDKSQVFVLDFQWPAQIRFGFHFGGQIHYIHAIDLSNAESEPSSATGSLPFRVEIFNVGTAAAETTFDLTSVSVASEPGFNPIGIRHSANTGTTAKAVTAFTPILSFRPKLTFKGFSNRGQVHPLGANILSISDPLLVQVFFNGALTGASFASAGDESSVEFDTAATAISGGELVAGFLVPAASQGQQISPGASAAMLSSAALGLDISGAVADVITLAAASLDGETGVYATADWMELR